MMIGVNRLSLVMDALSARALLMGNSKAIDFMRVSDRLVDYNGGFRSSRLTPLYQERKRLTKELKHVRELLNGL